MEEVIDLGPCRARLHRSDGDRCVVLLPGESYVTRAPLLWFGREVALLQGWSVLEVLDERPDDHEEFSWARDRAERALSHASGTLVAVVGKSLASGAAALIAERDLPAVWLTPLVKHELVREGLSRTRQPTLLIAGTGDDMWERAAVPDNPALKVVELERLDHALQLRGDLRASFDALYKVTKLVGEFLESLTGVPTRFEWIHPKEVKPPSRRLSWLDVSERQPAAAGGRVSRGLVGAIRPIAAAVIRDGDRILVWDDHDPATGEVVAVPLAGGIEFGETGEQAIARELEEEIGATPTRIRYLGLLEDIFDWAGERRHELYLVFAVDLAEQGIYEADEVNVVEPDGTAYLAGWRSLSEFGTSARLVPDGLLELIQQSQR